MVNNLTGLIVNTDTIAGIPLRRVNLIQLLSDFNSQEAVLRIDNQLIPVSNPHILGGLDDIQKGEPYTAHSTKEREAVAALVDNRILRTWKGETKNAFCPDVNYNDTVIAAVRVPRRAFEKWREPLYIPLRYNGIVSLQEQLKNYRGPVTHRN